MKLGVVDIADRHGSARVQHGVEVNEQELGLVNAQRMFRLRCECGRPWFELEPPQLVTCPACGKVSLVRK